MIAFNRLALSVAVLGVCSNSAFALLCEPPEWYEEFERLLATDSNTIVVDGVREPVGEPGSVAGALGWPITEERHSTTVERIDGEWLTVEGGDVVHYVVIEPLITRKDEQGNITAEKTILLPLPTEPAHFIGEANFLRRKFHQ